MKHVKKFLLVLLALTLCFAAFSCGGGGDDTCTSHTDSDKDGICDTCKEEIPDEAPEDVILIEGGEANFQIVMGSNVSTDNRMMIEQDIVRELKNEYDIVVDCVKEGASSDKEQDIEVLIGYVENRGEDYAYDYHELGEKGYMIKIVGTKVLVTAGSDDALADVLEEFMEDILGMGEEDEIIDVTMTADMQINKPQTGYKVTSLAVNGTDMKGYTIATDTADAYYSNVAKALQATLYTRTGYWLEIVTPDKATDKSIVIKHVDKGTVSGNGTYSVKADGSKLVISCAYDNMLENATTKFATEFIVTSNGDVNFTGDVYNQDISFVTYEDFGARGNGSTDDFEAIYKAHAFANQCGQTVIAKSGACYYIKNTCFIAEGDKSASVHTALIQTNVIWTGAEFIIDDRDIDVLDKENVYLGGAPIFKVIPDDDLAMFMIDGKNENGGVDAEELAILAALLESGIHPDTTNIPLDIGYDGSLMIIPYNNSHKVYRRQGYGGYAGDEMHEVIVIDKNGNVSDETPIMFDYTSIDYIEVYKLDESTAITIDGGTFRTRASSNNCITYNENGSTTSVSGYIQRNLSVNRSYTTVKNVKHLVTDEATLEEQVELQQDGTVKIVLVAPCYSGFFSSQSANHVTFESCTFTGRRCYQRPEGGTGGTYDLSAYTTNKIVFLNCNQSNFWVNVDSNNIITASTADTPGALPSMSSVTVKNKSLKMHWGVGGTNFCKNMEYINSTLSRFDAHQGLYNGKIENSTVNYLAITGNGSFTIENSTYYAEGPAPASNSLFHLRSDYGSTWNGDITVKNVTAYVYRNGTDYKGNYLFYHSYTNWYYGYTVGFPSISIDNLDFYDIDTRKPLAKDSEIILVGTSVLGAIHLTDVSKSDAVISVTDYDKDNLVDEQLYDSNLDGIIAECNAVHVDENENGFCDECNQCVGAHVDVHKDTDEDGICDKCGNCFGAHTKDVNGGTLCTVCSQTYTRTNAICDSKCDECDAPATNGIYTKCNAVHVDENGDRMCDKCDRVDIDGNGSYYTTSYDYTISAKGEYSSKGDYTSGIPLAGTKDINLNPVKPPEYIKILGNDGVDTDGDGEGDGGYIYTVRSTAGSGISDGGYYDSNETFGGFFGDTKFVYAVDENGKDIYFVGTNHLDQTETTTFKFFEVQ